MVKNYYQDAFWSGLAKKGIAQKGDIYVRGTVGDSVVFSPKKLKDVDFYIGFKSRVAIEERNADWIDSEKVVEEGLYLFGVADEVISNVYNKFPLTLDELVECLLERGLVVNIEVENV